MVTIETPCNPEAEKAILSSFLLAPVEVGGLCAERLASDDFFTGGYRTIFDVLMEMWRDGNAIDAITVTERLKSRALFEAVGGPGMISDLCCFMPTAANAPMYVDILREKRSLRSVLSTCREFAKRSIEEQEHPQELLTELERRVLEINAPRDNGEHSWKDLVIDSLRRFEEAHDRGGRLKGLSTGLTALDNLTGGICGGELVVIAAETSGGKTALALKFLEAISIEQRLPALVFSFEMSREELADRLLCSDARYDLKDFRRGHMAQNSSRFAGSSKKIAASPIIIRDDPDLGIPQMRAIARRLKRKRGIAAVIVDYLQLVPSVQSGRKESREEEVAKISRGLKAMAKELDVPVIALSQLNDDGRTRESRAISHDANLLLLIQMDNKSGPERHFIKIAKQRNGPRDRFPVTFLKHCARFENYAPEPSCS